MYVDVALLKLSSSVPFWISACGPCGGRAWNIEACGYPGDPPAFDIPPPPQPVDLNKLRFNPYCSSGTTPQFDFCSNDAYRALSSDNACHQPGQSGGPVFARDFSKVVAVLSGIGATQGVYAPLDKGNSQLLYDPDLGNTVWSRSGARSPPHAERRGNAAASCRAQANARRHATRSMRTRTSALHRSPPPLHTVGFRATSGPIKTPQFATKCVENAGSIGSIVKLSNCVPGELHAHLEWAPPRTEGT